VQVRSVPVQTSHVGLEQLQVRPPRVDEMRSVEASLRLDAIASAGGWLGECVAHAVVYRGSWGRGTAHGHV
jgi:RNA-binding protein YlmH